MLGIGLDKVLLRGPVKFPVLASPKYDGIRVITSDLTPDPGLESVPVCRSLKQVPNEYIRRAIGELHAGFDGEVVTYDASGQMDPFSTVQSRVMSEVGKPTFTYHIFDHVNVELAKHEQREGYADRIRELPTLIFPSYCHVVEQRLIESMDELEAFEELCVQAGYEGICFRPPNSIYKYGRSTDKQQSLVKVKRFETSEGAIDSFMEEYANDNPAAPNELGYAERSSHQANMRGKGTLGAFICRPLDGGETFKIGSGFTATQRAEFWRLRDQLRGKLVRYKHQPHGRKDRPRTPIFLGFRDGRDMPPQLQLI